MDELEEIQKQERIKTKIGIIFAFVVYHLVFIAIGIGIGYVLWKVL